MQTLGDIITDLLVAGADRGALVRPQQVEASHTIPVAVCVLTLSEAARLRLAPPLIEILRELGDSPRREIGTITSKIGLKEIFELSETAINHWAWFELPFGHTRVIATIFTGPICERVAAICNANGAPCSLDPAKAAPGYQLEEAPTDPIEATEVTNPAIAKEWLQSTGLAIQLAGAPDAALLFVASHGRTTSCLCLQSDEGRKVWLLHGGSKEARRAKANAIRTEMQTHGAELF